MKQKNIDKDMNTNSIVNINPAFKFLCCPIDLELLEIEDDHLICTKCAASFHMKNNKAIIIDEAKSLFKNDVIFSMDDHRQFPESTGFKSQLRKLLPVNNESRDKSSAMTKIKKMMPDSPEVLIIGCGFSGGFYKSIFPDNLVLTDVTLQGDAEIACDGHSLPFFDNSFDLIIADQVLEHVANPWKVASEITRCLKVGGIVYSGIPFFFHIHGEPFDFQRFTPAGHMQLYPDFQTVELSLSGGPIGTFALSLLGISESIFKGKWVLRFFSFGIRLLTRPFAFIDKKFKYRKKSVSVPLGTIYIGKKDNFQRSPSQIFEEYNKLANF